MPIRPEFRRFYGKFWRAYRLALIAARGSRCSKCGREVTKYLNLAHINHDPKTAEVALLCPTDHNRHDAPHRLAVWRRNKARRVGQLWLWPEVQWAPYALWMVPPRERPKHEGSQGDLF